MRTPIIPQTPFARKSSWLRIGTASLLAIAMCPPALAQRNPSMPDAPPSNVETGVSMDRVIGDASKAVTSIFEDAIMVRPILTQGDPLQPAAPGAVLRYRKRVSLGTMMPGEVSPLSRQDNQLVIYVKSGHGRVDDGQKQWDLRPGYAILIPPGVQHRLSDVGDDQLKMIIMEEPTNPEVSAAKGILVRDTGKLLYVENDVHWSNMSKAPFADVGERFLIVYMGPRSIAGPHAHNSETEEGWVKLTDAPAWLQIGSEIRPWKADMGMVVPPNSKTVHAAINTSNQTQAWFYFARFPGDEAHQNEGKPQFKRSPAIAAAEVTATVQPTPIPQ